MAVRTYLSISKEEGVRKRISRLWGGRRASLRLLVFSTVSKTKSSLKNMMRMTALRTLTSTREARYRCPRDL